MKYPKSSENAIEAPESDYLYVGPSQLVASGNGLHTAIDIYTDEIIAIFKGEILTRKQAESRSALGLDQYFVLMLNGSIMDSMPVDCFAKYANDASGFTRSGYQNNAFIGLDEQDNVCLIANRNIKIGEEIFCRYGRKYWAKHGKSVAEKQVASSSGIL